MFKVSRSMKNTASSFFIDLELSNLKDIPIKLPVLVKPANKLYVLDDKNPPLVLCESL